MRYTVLHDDKGLSFGQDHACGEFLQVWTRPQDEVDRGKQDQYGPDPDEMLVDEDAKFTGFTRERMMRLLEDHGFTVEELMNEAQKNMGFTFETE